MIGVSLVKHINSPLQAVKNFCYAIEDNEVLDDDGQATEDKLKYDGASSKYLLEQTASVLFDCVYQRKANKSNNVKAKFPQELLNVKKQKVYFHIT